ncbi:MAG: flagellar basal body L-ring protein FlgH [Chitinivibrionales bacterium]|nr:flagellar basal body L-ring protein FlgH [Chitinivibrionales bacterium]
MMSRFRKTATFLLIAACYLCRANSIYSLYTDHRAMKVDDILTVIIVEEAKAGSQSGTKTSKSNSVGAQSNGGSGLLDFLPSFGTSAGTNVDYDGKGGTTRQGSLVAKISARVTKVLDNGNLVIDGSKVVEINNEKEIIKLSGIIRPQDIETDNIIYSYNVADAKINYSGKGVNTTARRPGLIARFFNWIF